MSYSSRRGASIDFARGPTQSVESSFGWILLAVRTGNRSLAPGDFVKCSFSGRDHIKVVIGRGLDVGGDALSDVPLVEIVRHPVYCTIRWEKRAWPGSGDPAPNEFAARTTLIARREKSRDVAARPCIVQDEPSGEVSQNTTPLYSRRRQKAWSPGE